MPSRVGGFDLHADTSVRANNRPWRDGTDQIALEPQELLEKLAALIPRPYTNLIVYHGVLAPNARWRRLGLLTSLVRDERHGPRLQAQAPLVCRSLSS